MPDQKRRSTDNGISMADFMSKTPEEQNWILYERTNHIPDLMKIISELVPRVEDLETSRGRLKIAVSLIVVYGLGAGLISWETIKKGLMIIGLL